MVDKVSENLTAFARIHEFLCHSHSPSECRR